VLGDWRQAVPYESRKQDLENGVGAIHPSIHPSLSLGPVLGCTSRCWSMDVASCRGVKSMVALHCVPFLSTSDIQPHTKVTRSDRSEASLKRSKSFNSGEIDR